MKRIRKLYKEEDGQALALVAFMLVGLLGFAALVIDVGMMYSRKAELQLAADAGALAGAQKLPGSPAEARVLARDLAKQNGAPESGITPETPYDGKNNKIRVSIQTTEPTFFARVLGIEQTTVTAWAVAENNRWSGDALPFLNLDGLAEDSPVNQPLDAWNKTGPGDKERIENGDLIITPSSIKVNFDNDPEDHIKFKKGKDMSLIKEPLQQIIKVGKKVYLISIKHSLIDSYQKKGTNELKNKDEVPAEDTVLLECEVTDDWNGTGSDTISLKFKAAYPWNNVKKTYLSATNGPPGGSSHLIK